ncbi:MAG: BTAD domain-containing putative transcriptional regulator [Acidimicrobiales bacterium]
MEVRLLGAMEAAGEGGTPLQVQGAKLRALLAILALDCGRVVSTERLVDHLWAHDPPAGVANSLQGLVSKLRRVLGSAELVVMRPPGYVLELEPDRVDVHRVDGLVVAARRLVEQGDLEQAVARLADAEGLWRGPALADFLYEDFAQPHIARLEELRLSTIEDRIDAELALARHQRIVGDLEALVADHPVRERLRGQLMVALYRSGRQADALRTFQDGRRHLADELGLEPGHALRELEAAILAHDPALEAPTTTLLATPVAREQRATIPNALTDLVGRDAELREVSGLLAAHRLVTLVGPGGVGKTRLALEVARAESTPLALGGCLVELAPVGDPDGVRPAIASALGLNEPDRLAEVIGDRGLLLLLDNCEHLVTAAAEVAHELLRQCPALQILATSREGLRVGGEVIWPVPPLDADDAVALFRARSRAAGAAVTTGDDADADTAIRDICARLDGLPLAIELAAARTRAFPIAQIAERLNDRFRLLTGGSRTALPRQQTLRAVVDWSYDLLFQDEQRVFERLAVFPGGCDLATAEAVCAGADLLADDLPDLIQALVDKSLVIAVVEGGSVRFTKLQTLAQYGREKLAERGEADLFRNAMAAHFAALSAESASAWTGERQRAWLTSIERERDNLRAALEWAVSTDDAETALTIAGGCAWPHWLAATISEGRRWLDEAFACAGPVSDGTRALALTGRGLLEFLSGAQDRADADLEAALAIFEQLGDVASMRLARSFYAEIADVRGDIEEARRRRLEVLASYDRGSDDTFSAAAVAYARGKLAVLDGDLAEAEIHYRAAAEGFSKIDRPVERSISLGMVADFDEHAGDYASAITVLDAAIAMNDELGTRGFVGSLLVRLGWALLHEGHVERAYVTYRRALEDARRVRNTPVLFLAHTGTGVVHRLRGDDDRAAAAATHALGLHAAGGPRRFRNRIDRQMDVLDGAAACCSVLAVIAAEAGDAPRAARLLGRAERLRDDAGNPVPPFQQRDVERAQELTRAVLGRDVFEAELAAGRHGDLPLEVIGGADEARPSSGSSAS